MALIDIRKARRAIQMRDMNTEDAAAMLEAILKEAVVVTASGSSTFQKKALEEVEQIRRDLLTNQINAGNRQSQLIGAYSHVADQLNAIHENAQKGEGGISKTLETLANNIPSADTFIAALMTANPLVGYGVKIFKDMAKGQREASKARREQRIQQQKLAAEELKSVEEMLEVEEERSDAAKEQKEAATAQKREYTRGGIYRPLLTGIREDLHEIQDVLGIRRVDESDSIVSEETKKLDSIGDDLDDSIKRISTDDSEVNDSIKAMSSDIVDIIKETSDDQIKNTKKISKEQDRESKLQRLKDSDTTGAPPALEGVNTMATSEKKNESLFSGLLGAFGLRAGLFAGIGSIIGTVLIKPIIGIFSVLKILALGALKLGIGLVAPALVVAGIFKFVEGFMKAEEILGKTDINLAEAVYAGLLNVGQAFLSFIQITTDYITDFFKLGKIDIKGFVNETLPRIINSSIEFIVDLYSRLKNGTKKIIDSVYENVIVKIKTTIEETIDTVRSVFTRITDIITGIPSALMDSLKEMRVIGPIIKKLSGDSNEIDESIEAIGERASSELVEESGRIVMDRIGKNITAPDIASLSLQRREQNMEQKEQGDLILNAPNLNTTNITNNQVVGGSAETNNPNNRYRAINNMNFYGR